MSQENVETLRQALDAFVTVRLDSRGKRVLRRETRPRLTLSVVARGAAGNVLLEHRRKLRIRAG